MPAVAASRSRETNVMVWGNTVAVMRGVQHPLNSVNRWTEWRSCRIDSLVLDEAFGVAGSMAEVAENNQSYC